MGVTAITKSVITSSRARATGVHNESFWLSSIGNREVSNNRDGVRCGLGALNRIELRLKDEGSCENFRTKSEDLFGFLLRKGN